MCKEITCTIHNNYYCKTVDENFIINPLMDGNALGLGGFYNDAIVQQLT